MTVRIGASGKIAAVLISLISSSAFAAVVALPQYNVSFNDVSVSGLSSGAYMAAQMHFAYSKTNQLALANLSLPYR